MDKIETNYPLAENALSDLTPKDPKFLLSDKFIAIAKRVLDTLYIFKKEPLSTSFRRIVGDKLLSQSTTVQNLGNALSILLHEVVRISNFKEPIAVLPAYKSAAFLQGAILNYSDISSAFAAELLKNRRYIHCVKLILEQLAPIHSQLTSNQSTLHFLKCSLCSVYNILKYCGEEARAIFAADGYTTLIMHFYESPIPDIKSISSLILAYLVTDEQFSRCMKDESIQFVINNIMSNFRQQKGPRRSFETPELCLALREMAKTDTSTSRILQCGGIQALGSVLSRGTSREKCAAALALLSLALHESAAAIARVQIRSALINDIDAQLSTLRNQMPMSISVEGRRGAIEDMVEDYRSFKSWILERGNLLPEVKAISPVDRRIKTALWMQSIFRRLQWEVHIDDELSERQVMGIADAKEQSHVMLSYSYVQKNIAHKIARAISQSGYRIWLDTQQMHTENDVMDAMAVAVEQAFVVCILYSEAYKRCPNTRMEAQYAQKLDKPMIFCRVEQNYLPGGWLGVLTARQTYIDFSGKFAFEDASGELLHRLASIKMSVKGEKAEINSKPLVTHQANEISLWDMEEVNEWFVNQGLPIVYRENISGKDLLFLKKMQSSAPESFFRFLSETWKIASVPVMRAFAEALEKL